MKTSLLKKNFSYFKALGHAKRLEIICLLQGHSLTVNQIVQMTALRQSTVSQHLMLLKNHDLVCTNKLGKEIYYSLCQEPFVQLAGFTKTLPRLNPVEDAEPTVIDPVCHMHLTPSVSSYTTEYDGVRHYFCGKGCFKQFSSLHKGVL